MGVDSENIGVWIAEEQRKLNEIKNKFSNILSITQETRSSQTKITERESTKSLKLLLVEDNPEDEFLMLRLLSKLNFFNVDVVHQGEEALNYLFGKGRHYHSPSFEKKPDLIFLDLRMPIMDGMEFLETAHEILRTHGIPVVIATSSNQEKNVTRCKELGVTGYLRKPIDPVELERMIGFSVGSGYM